MTEFYERLKQLNQSIAERFTDDGGEGHSPVSVYPPAYIELNYPWVYLHFGYSGPLSLNSLKKIEKMYTDFTAVEGGSLESVSLARRGSGFVVKLVYVEDKKKAPAETQRLPNSDSDSNDFFCTDCGADGPHQCPAAEEP